jgi:hypothetical protein
MNIDGGLAAGGVCAVGSFCAKSMELLRGVGFGCAARGAVGLIGNGVVVGEVGEWDRMTLGFVLCFFCGDAGLCRVLQDCAGFGMLRGEDGGAELDWFDGWVG